MGSTSDLVTEKPPGVDAAIGAVLVAFQVISRLSMRTWNRVVPASRFTSEPGSQPLRTFQDNFFLLQVNLLTGKSSSVRTTAFSISFYSVSAIVGHNP